ncbi:hypothetical protein FVEN_g1512 [Fusarium venenatum]|uniref:Uncharacterized protein n=1 Tax=Fusarium venenatum TaxID=56646 RepID=A0A2L2SQZ5_9HYPO|nr:uncharacterized protein FVRRES_13277 [Fusarium venenatum]KAG8360691.1 hypothetical protein FVEN_g1512 [Fusarium venenatum]KAH6979826.1 hypothetical protein EDB82DRAFT_270928 [Fusarium venenatum]CEI40791.1 unnamed protein product [Fusarium venenatum]
MAGRLKDAIKKRASRLLHRNKDEERDTPEGADSQPSSNRNSLNSLSRKSQPRHRKSLSLLSRSSKAEREDGHDVHQTQAPENRYDVHPAVQPLEADLEPKTPRLERQRPGIKSEDTDDQNADGNAQGKDYFDGASDEAARQDQPKQENANRTTHQNTSPANSPDAVELERRLSRLAVSRQELELPEIDVAPLTPFEYVQEVDTTQAKLSRLAIGQEGPEKASTHIEPLSQESDVNLESNASQEANIKHNLEAIHLRDAEFDRINKEVQAGTNGEANFHLQNSLDFDRTVHNQEPVVHESVRPHVHTIYEPKRTLSIHHHEHRTLIQPIKDPNPTILPEQHWLQDDRTGEIYRIPDELGKQLM